MEAILFVTFVAAEFFAGYRLGFHAGRDSETWVDVGVSESTKTFTTTDPSGIADIAVESSNEPFPFDSPFNPFYMPTVPFLHAHCIWSSRCIAGVLRNGLFLQIRHLQALVLI